MTTLTKPVSRVTAKRISGRQVILTIADCGSQPDARIGANVDEVLVLAVHGQMLAGAKRSARQSGTPWRVAKKQFIAQNTIPA